MESNSYAFAYKLDNNIHLEIVRTIPTANTELFTGNILVEDWEGNKLRFFKYENGEFLSEHEFVENSDENGRIATFENVYTCTTTIYYTCWGEIPDDCRETGRETTCVLKEVRQIGGHGTNGEDYGGGGSGGSTPVTCSDGYFADANGNCINLELEDFLNSDVWDQQNPYDDWNKLTQCEKDFFQTYPAFLYQAKKDRTMAETAAQQRFPNCSLYNGVGDAFRHAYFSALNAQRMGYINAKTLGDCHETETPINRQNEKAMDLHNNQWGYNYASTYGVVQIDQFYNAFIEAFDNGEIEILKEC